MYLNFNFAIFVLPPSINLEQYEYSLKKYDAVIFEGFDPVPLFEQNKKAY